MIGTNRRMGKVVGRGRWAIPVLLGALAVSSLGFVLIRPRFFPTTLEQGRAAYDRGAWGTASRFAAARLKEAPLDPEALRLLARANARGGHDESARALFSRLGGASALQAEDLFLLGRMIDRAGDHETARECWVAGLRADPKSSELLNEFARLYFDGAQFDLAEQTAKALAARPSWEARGEWFLGRIALARDEPAAAVEPLRRALDRDPAIGSKTLLVRALLGAGRAKEAGERLGSLLASHPDPEAYWLLSRAKLQEGAIAEAVAALAKSGSYREEHPLDHDPSPYVGAERCAPCHKDAYQAQQNSLHARTYLRDPSARQLPMPERPVPDPAAHEVIHTLTPEDGRVLYQTEDQGKTARALVEYVFGSGHRGRTLVGRDESGQARELRLSQYADSHSWEVTTGHPAIPPAREGYLGRVLAPDDLYSCFACHTTTPQLTLEGKGPASADRGIGCERCHGPGGNHLLAVAAKFTDLSIAQPRVASGAEVVALCGQCHNPLRRTVGPSDPVAARFPATTLTWSQCYIASKGSFDCRTCHDPHRDLEPAPAHYEAKCRTCHAPSRAGSVCPVDARTGCVGCHMPKANIGVPHSVFTDHHIRVHPR